METCRYCDKPVETPVKTLSYWQSIPFWCHTECKVQGERQEAIDCQTIDADCNDCLHYQRGKLPPKLIEKTKRPNGSWATVTFQPNIFTGGHCLKFNKTVEAQPNKWSGLLCFEHRRVATPVP